MSRTVRSARVSKIGANRSRSTALTTVTGSCGGQQQCTNWAAEIEPGRPRVNSRGGLADTITLRRAFSSAANRSCSSSVPGHPRNARRSSGGAMIDVASAITTMAP